MFFHCTLLFIYLPRVALQFKNSTTSKTYKTTKATALRWVLQVLWDTETVSVNMAIIRVMETTDNYGIYLLLLENCYKITDRYYQ